MSVPFDPGLKLHRATSDTITPEEKQKLAKLPYRSLVGCLLYLAIGTRPDISYAIQQLSQYLNSYSYAHWNTAICVIRYLKGTRELKLVLGGTKNINLFGFLDLDWANCLDTRRSVGGYCFSLGSGIISWSVKKQKTVATSSCEAEYTAAFKASKEAVWLQMLLHEINLGQEEPTQLLCDNNAAIALSKDPGLHSRAKHIDIHYHFLHEKVTEKNITLSYVNTHNNLADIFTKGLDRIKFT